MFKDVVAVYLLDMFCIFYMQRVKVGEILEKKLKQNLEVLRSDLSKLKIEKESAAYV